MNRFKFIGASIVAIICTLSSCSTEAIAQDYTSANIVEDFKVESNTFTVVWSSNQEDPYVGFSKYILRDCVMIPVAVEIHREHRFEISIEDLQRFDITILRASSVKNPELYIAIYKGNELQYEQEINSNGFTYSGYVNKLGNLVN